jgi:hypothetical protein
MSLGRIGREDGNVGDRAVGGVDDDCDVRTRGSVPPANRFEIGAGSVNLWVRRSSATCRMDPSGDDNSRRSISSREALLTRRKGRR